MYGWFVGNNVFVQVTFLRVGPEIGNVERGVYVFLVFCLGVVEVVGICLSGFLFPCYVLVLCYE